MEFALAALVMLQHAMRVLSPPNTWPRPTLMGTADCCFALYFGLSGLFKAYRPFSFRSRKQLCPSFRAHSYSHDTLLEVAPEGVRLVVLDLAVLHGAASQVVVQLCGVDGCTALLILGGVLPDPKVNVLGEEAPHPPGLGGSRRGG